jgi:hypothetical protein
VTGAVTDARAEVAGRLRGHAAMCREPGYSPFYAVLLDHMADDVEAGGPSWELMADTATRPVGEVHQLRILGFVHRMVLSGKAPALAAHFPSTDGDGDAEAAWPIFHPILSEHLAEIRPWLDQAPQTNEVGRCAPLGGGFAVVAAETGLPLRALEVGASAGLNLRFDHFFYSANGASAGDPDSPVRFVDVWSGGTPPFQAGLPVVERRGCDLAPVDVTTDDGRMLLLGYIWPDQHERFGLLRGALEVAARVPAVVDRANALDWLPARLDEVEPGVATVVFHSVALQYFPSAAVDQFTAVLHERGGRASTDAPLAWLALERNPGFDGAELRLTTWPGGEERLLAKASFHVGPVSWLV